jgi:ribosome maturation factor RimP
MRQDPYDLHRFLEPTITGLGFELVGIEYHPSGGRSLLRVYIDSENGVTVDDCARVSYQVSGVLDVEDPIPGNYQLEISSPGLDRPLFRSQDYERFAGQLVSVRLLHPMNGRRKFKGRLEGLHDQDVVLELEDGMSVRLPLVDIGQAHLVPEF